MDNLKDSLRNNNKTVTLSAAQINFLSQMQQRMQAILDAFQQTMASEYLHLLAVEQFGMDPDKDLHFEFHPEREFDNLIITEKVVGKQ